MKKHWLMKTEPETFGIDDLARVKIEPWTGVRNPMARNMMRDQMSVGDEVLFYHSSTNPTGVAGLARVARTGVVDATQFDPRSPYYDAKAQRDEPRWICVEVEFVEKFPAVVPLTAMRARKSLAGMMLMTWPRLSVQPVAPKEFKTIVAMARAHLTTKRRARPSDPRRIGAATEAQPTSVLDVREERASDVRPEAPGARRSQPAIGREMRSTATGASRTRRRT